MMRVEEEEGTGGAGPERYIINVEANINRKRKTNYWDALRFCSGSCSKVHNVYRTYRETKQLFRDEHRGRRRSGGTIVSLSRLAFQRPPGQGALGALTAYGIYTQGCDFLFFWLLCV